jgi:hypothetical protein
MKRSATAAAITRAVVVPNGPIQEVSPKKASEQADAAAGRDVI